MYAPLIKAVLVLLVAAALHAPQLTHRTTISASVMAQWHKVAVCETGADWTMRGPVYSGGLGVTDRAWSEFGGLRFSANAGNATPVEQVIVARRIEGSNYVPDQTGCDGSW